MTQNRPILAWSSLATLPSFQVEEFCPLRLRKRTGRPVRPIMGHGIQCIHDREDASDDRDILTLETLRIAASVMVLVMATNYVERRREERDDLQDLDAGGRMRLDHEPLLRGERTRLPQHGFRGA